MSSAPHRSGLLVHLTGQVSCYDLKQNASVSIDVNCCVSYSQHTVGCDITFWRTPRSYNLDQSYMRVQLASTDICDP